MTTDKPTVEEIVDVVRDVVNRDEAFRRVSPQSPSDVADKVARARGWDGSTRDPDHDPNARHSHMSGWITEAQAMARYGVSVAVVKRLLTQAADQGLIVAVAGDHWAISGRYGSRANATYYITPEAVEALTEQERTRRQDKHEAEVAKLATEALIAEHNDEYRDLVARNTETINPRKW